jgi:hypothetical protein
MNNVYHKGTISHLAGACISVLLLRCTVANAQITFNASEMLNMIGESVQEYIITNANPSGMIGSTGGPQVWNFSEHGDYTRNVYIVSATNGNHEASFPGASYAEYFLDGVSMFNEELDYYSIVTNVGQIYYGSYNPNSGASSWSPPMTNVPAVVQYGSSWTNSTSSDNLAPYVFVDTITSTADAYGTIVLPEIGSFQALRVNQLTEEEELVEGIPVGTYYVREYFWLVPGIGEAVDIVSTDASEPPAANFASAAEIRIVFPQGVANLRIQLQGDSANLTWPAATTQFGYQLQVIDDLSMTNWQVLASPASNSWLDPLTNTQRFYRVFIEP